MKEKPILFKPELVRAILEGRKTQTRRVMRWQPLPESAFDYPEPDRVWSEIAPTRWARVDDVPSFRSEDGIFRCPFGAAGDRLWVRETWYCDHYDCKPPFGKASAEKIPTFRRHLEYLASHDCRDWEAECPSWRPSIHMPRWACRLVLPIAEVRVERLQDISEEDARAEGVDPVPAHGRWVTRPRHEGGHWSARPAFAALWDSAYGKTPGGSWDANPWVWVVRWSHEDILTCEAARPSSVSETCTMASAG